MVSVSCWIGYLGVEPSRAEWNWSVINGSGENNEIVGSVDLKNGIYLILSILIFVNMAIRLGSWSKIDINENK